jgi:CheY-like chemotaxis protein
MNVGPGRPSGGGGRNRRRRGRRPRGGHQSNRRDPHGGIYTAPMDHSYRAALAGGNNGGSRPGRQRPGFAPSYAQAEPEPLPMREDAASRIFGFVDDLFFQAKIQETARKLNVKVEFVKSEPDFLERVKQNGEEKPSLIILDLNSNSVKPLSLIPKLKSKLKKTSVIGFLSHVQGDLKQKAHEVGCDMVLPRSAFSQNLPQLLRRHGSAEEVAE